MTQLATARLASFGLDELLDDQQSDRQPDGLPPEWTLSSLEILSKERYDLLKRAQRLLANQLGAAEEDFTKLYRRWQQSEIPDGQALADLRKILESVLRLLQEKMGLKYATKLWVSEDEICHILKFNVVSPQLLEAHMLKLDEAIDLKRAASDHWSYVESLAEQASAQQMKVRMAAHTATWLRHLSGRHDVSQWEGPRAQQPGFWGGVLASWPDRESLQETRKGACIYFDASLPGPKEPSPAC